MMKVAAGFYCPSRGFYFLHFIPVDQVETWLLSTDCDMLSSDAFNWDGDRVPIDQLSPTIIHLHALDKTFNRVCGWNGRGIVAR